MRSVTVDHFDRKLSAEFVGVHGWPRATKCYELATKAKINTKLVTAAGKVRKLRQSDELALLEHNIRVGKNDSWIIQILLNLPDSKVSFKMKFAV